MLGRLVVGVADRRPGPPGAGGGGDDAFALRDVLWRRFGELVGERVDQLVRIVLGQVDVEDVVDYLKPPVGTWAGKRHRITIDSATLMNKGLEVIEARVAEAARQGAKVGYLSALGDDV